MPTIVSIADLALRTSAITLAQFGTDDETAIQTLAEATVALADADVQANLNAVISDAEESYFSIVRGCIDVTDSDNFAAMKPQIIKIALFYLYSRHRGEVPEYVALENQNALQHAYKVQKGEILLQRDPQMAPSKVRSTDPLSSTSFGNFNTDSLTGWSFTNV